MIVIDSREAAEAPKIREELSKIVKVEVRPLDAGDYLITGVERSALIERKTIMDFLNSAKDRLWDQLSLLKDFEGEKVLLLEGYLPLYRKRGWNEASVLAMMDSIINKWGIPILYMPDIRATLTYLAWKDKSLGSAKESREKALRVRSREMSIDEQALYTMEGLCGHETAKAILERFGSLGAAISFIYQSPNAAAVLSTIKVGGRRIPTKIIERIIKVVRFEYSRSYKREEPASKGLLSDEGYSDEDNGAV